MFQTTNQILIVCAIAFLCCVCYDCHCLLTSELTNAQVLYVYDYCLQVASFSFQVQRFALSSQVFFGLVRFMWRFLEMGVPANNHPL